MKSNRNRSVSFVQSDGGPFRSGVIVWVPFESHTSGRGAHAFSSRKRTLFDGNRLITYSINSPLWQGEELWQQSP
jgi:hypothetical protein